MANGVSSDSLESGLLGGSLGKPLSSPSTVALPEAAPTSPVEQTSGKVETETAESDVKTTEEAVPSSGDASASKVATPVGELLPEASETIMGHAVAVEAPTSDLRDEVTPVENPAEPEKSTDHNTRDDKNDSFTGDSTLKSSDAPQSPVSPPDQREASAIASGKLDAITGPTPPQSTAASPHPEVAETLPTERTHAPPETLQDAPMEEATASDHSVAVKHDRVEDPIEPPSKRARTDDGTLETSQAVKFAEEADPERKMTLNRQKYCLVVLRQLKRSKDSAPFLQPVDPVKLKIPDYPKIVTDPQDLGTIEAKLKKNEFSTVDQFIDSVQLVWSNCQKYNGAESAINLMALRLKESFERQIRSMPAAEHPDPNSSPAGRGPKGKKGAKPAAGSTVATRPRKMSSPATPNGVPAIRRESMGIDGRPKREIHAPPPKSLPYQTPVSRKGKNAKQLKFCGTVLKELTHKKFEAFAFPFYQPVDAVALGLHDYHTVIKKPMDLATMQQKLNAGEYESADDFEYDMRLMFRNCFKYNGPGTPVNAMGKRLESVFQQKWAEKPIARPAGAGSDTSDESDGDLSSKQQAVEMLKKQLQAMQNQIDHMHSSKKTKKVKKDRYDDDDGGMGPRDYDYAPTKKGSRKRRDSNEEADESPMFPTFEQKQALSTKMNYMTEHQQPVVVQILKRTDPNFDPDDEEVELDVDKVHPKTLRLLWNWIMDDIQPSFLRKKAAKSKKNRSVLSESEQQRQIEQLEARIQTFNGGDAYGSSRYGNVPNDDSSDADSNASSEDDD